MPTYEYRCPLGHDFEIFYRKMSLAPADVACPDCGRTAERMMSAGAGLVFKGSGFYITDYGKDGKKDERAARAASETKNEKSDAKGDKGDVKSDAPGALRDAKSPAQSDGAATPAAESKTTAKEPAPVSSSSRSSADAKTSHGTGAPPAKAKE